MAQNDPDLSANLKGEQDRALGAWMLSLNILLSAYDDMTQAEKAVKDAQATVQSAQDAYTLATQRRREYNERDLH